MRLHITFSTIEIIQIFSDTLYMFLHWLSVSSTFLINKQSEYSHRWAVLKLRWLKGTLYESGNFVLFKYGMIIIKINYLK